MLPDVSPRRYLYRLSGPPYRLLPFRGFTLRLAAGRRWLDHLTTIGLLLIPGKAQRARVRAAQTPSPSHWEVPRSRTPSVDGDPYLTGLYQTFFHVYCDAGSEQGSCEIKRVTIERGEYFLSIANA